MKIIFGSILLVSILFGASPLWAASGEVIRLRGEVFQKVKKKKESLKRGSDVEWGQWLMSEETDSYLLVKIDGISMALKGPFKIKLRPPKKKSAGVVDLLHGKIRVAITKWPKGKNFFGVRTRQATAGVRGTDFTFSSFPLMKETEIVTFSGEVEFSDRKRKRRVKVKKGYWGGVGGRFGKRIRKPVKLPNQALEELSNELPLE